MGGGEVDREDSAANVRITLRWWESGEAVSSHVTVNKSTNEKTRELSADRLG